MTDSTGTTDRRDDGASRSAGRFAPQPAEDERSLGAAVLAGVALVALVVGVPALLLGLGGRPWVPTGLPSRADLVQPVTTAGILTVLVTVVWVVWLFFVVCVVSETVAALRGGIAPHIPLGGPFQQLARALVGSLLLAGVLAGPAANAATVLDAPAATPTVSSAVQEQAVEDTAEQEAPAGVGEEQARSGQEDRVLDGRKVYTVKAPKAGYHDNLWDIAERHLGDGRRYLEIFELNKDRVQADGRSLDLARLIQPGWLLEMPDDAVGVDRVGASDGSGADGGGPTAEQAVAHEDAGAVDDGSTAGGGVPGATEESAGTGRAALAGGGLLAAGILGALAAQRRRRLGRAATEPAAEAEAALHVAANPERADALDRVLRNLAATCLTDNLALPSPYAAIVDDGSVELLLAPPRPDACSGWEVLDEGRRWRTTDLQAAAPRHAAAPYPALVGLGVDEQGRDVLIDLEAAGGGLEVSGAPHVATEVATALAVQAATNAWADEVRVTAAGLALDLAGVGDDRIRVTDDVAALLPEFEGDLVHRQADVLTGRMVRHGSVPSQLLVVGVAPDADVLERLAALTGPARQALSVLVVGDFPGARWRLRVTDDGTLSIPNLDLHVVANRVGASQLEAVAELFAAAREDAAQDADRPAVERPGRPVDDAVWGTSGKRVGILGPVAVEGLAGLEDARVAEAEEILVLLATSEEPVHPHVLAGAVWPRGVTDDVRDAAVERAAAALGVDPEGRNHLRRDADGRHHLGPDVVCDWDVFRTLLAASRSAGSEARETDLLDRALGLVRGEPFAGRAPRRYAWVAATGLEHRMRTLVVDAAHRLSTLRLQADPGHAQEAARAGLQLEPTSFLLWRDLLRAAHREGTASARRVVDQMSVCLERYAVPLDAETESLVEELLPGLRSLPASG